MLMYHTSNNVLLMPYHMHSKALTHIRKEDTFKINAMQRGKYPQEQTKPKSTEKDELRESSCAMVNYHMANLGESFSKDSH